MLQGLCWSAQKRPPAARHRHGLAHAPAQQRGGYSHVASGARVSGQGQHSPIIMCLEVCHRLHYRPVPGYHVDCCAPAAWSGRHVADTTMSNRVRLAVRHDANVHLAPRDKLETLEVALVDDEARLRVCAPGCAVRHRCRHGGYSRGGELRENEPQSDHSDPKSQTIHDKNTTIHQPRTKSLLFVEV